MLNENMAEGLYSAVVVYPARSVVLALGEEAFGKNAGHQHGRGKASTDGGIPDDAIGLDKLREGIKVTLNPLKLLGEGMFWWGNRRSARSTIQLIEEQEITPRTLVDMGANNSQWARYLHERWPEMQIHSFEPNLKCQPLGMRHFVALGNIACTVGFDACDKQGHVITGAETLKAGNATVAVVRFEDYWAYNPLVRPAVLKIDCENFTYAALRGCGNRLKDFDIVHLEMMNTRDEPQFRNEQAAIGQVMLDAGFTRWECVDAAVWPRSVHYYDLVFIR